MRWKSIRAGFALSKLSIVALGFLTIANAQPADKNKDFLLIDEYSGKKVD